MEGLLTWNKNNKLTPAQRAILFAQATRQNIQPLPAISASENSAISFNLHKVRLTSKLQLLVSATLTATHATETSYTPATLHRGPCSAELWSKLIMALFLTHCGRDLIFIT